MNRIVPIWVISFVLLRACAALCQNERASADLLQGDRSNSPEVQGQEMRTWRPLPDAPSSVQAPTLAEKFRVFAYESPLPPVMRVATATSDVRRGPELRHFSPEPRSRLIPSDELLFPQNNSTNFVVRYLCPPLVKRSMLYHPSTSTTLIGRTIDAASHIFVTRDESGKKRLDASYFLGILSLVAAHSARRPYWARSTSAPFNDFGSMIGNDAGLNLFHEFEPGIRQMVKGHTPRFAFRVGERLSRDQNLKEVVSSPAR